MAEYVNKAELRKALYDADAITFDGLDIIDAFPAADVQLVKHAMWKRIPEYTGSPWGYFECTNCGERSYTLSENYCPNCGAMMCGGEF